MTPARLAPYMLNVLQDIRFGLRLLSTLPLAIGANSAVFSVVNSVLL